MRKSSLQLPADLPAKCERVRDIERTRKSLNTSLSSAATARRAHKLSKIEAQGCQKTIKNSLNGLNAISCVPHSLPRFAYFGVVKVTTDVYCVCGNNHIAMLLIFYKSTQRAT